MAKRKETDMAQMNLRLPEKLRRMIEVEAKKNGWSLNRELVRRLEQSFFSQSTSDIATSAAMSASLATAKILTAQWNEFLKAHGGPELKLDEHAWRSLETQNPQLPLATTDANETADERHFATPLSPLRGEGGSNGET
jgi:hypothetical protein